jgi:UPF0755 protein
VNRRTLALVVVGCLAAIAVAAALWLYARAMRPFRGYTGPEQLVEIPARGGSRTIGAELVRAGVIRNVLTYRLALWQSGKSRQLKAGEYRFDRPMTPGEVIDKIARGDVYLIHLTLPEGLNLHEMARLFETHGFGPATAFIAAAGDPSSIRDLDPTAPDLEGYLFPDTYLLPRRADAARLVRQMATEFEHAFTPEMRQEAQARGMSVREVVTLASIVEKETAKPDERPLVAAVYENRLRLGMPLQCDPTVIYALERTGHYDGNLRRVDLALDSPYNTYRHPGLPPGPIASPSRASLEAVLHPADVDYLYFVSRNDGSHVFAHTLEEHNQNVRKWQVEYFRQRRLAQEATRGAPAAGRH